MIDHEFLCLFPFRNILQENSDYCNSLMMFVSTAASLHRKPASAWTCSNSFHVQGHFSIKIQFVLLKKKKHFEDCTSGITSIKHNTKIYNSKSAFISPIKTIKYIM